MNVDKRIFGSSLWLLLLIFGLWVANYYETLRYIFFLRVPILVSLLLVTLPVISIYLVPAFLKNLFVLRNNGQLTLVIIGATLAGVSTVIVYNVILMNAYLRFGVTQAQPIPQTLQYIIAILLGYPISITAITFSQKEIESQEPTIWKGVLWGVIISLFFIIGVESVQDFLGKNESIKQIIQQIFLILPRNLQQGYILPSGQLAPGIIEAIAFSLVLLTVYALGYQLGKPQPKSHRFELPALVYITLILGTMVFLLAGMSFFLDYIRIPVVLLFIAISATSYSLLQVDHFYELKHQPYPKPDSQQWKQAISKRLEYQKSQTKTLVVVCASGGGIQASGWTTAVLTGLQKVIDTSFTQSIGWISAVSGGSVGTMYYLDRFSENGYPEVNEFNQIFNSATADSLDAIGWGMAYPDLLRFIGLPFLVPNPLEDRGKAVEIDWEGELKNPTASLADWGQKVLDGILPIPIFNATLVEDGRRFLISPMTFPNPDNNPTYTDFNTLYPEYDLGITTSARLSATFPYVSPVSRPNRKTRSIFHVADGGYVDNFGVATSVFLLEELLEDQSHGIQRVLFLQINAFPPPQTSNENPGSQGWLMEVIGTLATLLNVRGPAQIASNTVDIQLLKQKWQNRHIEIADFTIAFPKEIDDKDPQPLSWQLTQEQKKAIKKGWDYLERYEDQDQVIKQIQRQWEEWHPQPITT